jgi:two-component system, LytTR family, response regulator
MMRALVVDDEPLTRAALAKILSNRADISEFDIADNAHQALATLNKRAVDVLLLDIHMPEMSGLQLVEELSRLAGPMPSVIFVTAYHEHAVEAFEKRAVDYILKPLVPARVHEALDLAAARSHQERSERLWGALKELSLRPQRSSRIGIKDKGRIVFIDVSDIISVEANGNYVLLKQNVGSYLLRETMAEISEKLAPQGFIRIHRSVLINGAHVESIQPGVGSEYILRTKTGKEFHVTRTYRANLKDLAQLWSGAEAFFSG